jgi:Hemolysin-type calcium-binding repeat (2 copies).
MGPICFSGVGSDSLSGASGDDFLFGEAGNDSIDGGQGNDFLRGGWGDDTYYFGLGSGQDTIESFESYDGNRNGFDKIVFGEGLVVSSFDFTAEEGTQGFDLILSIRGSSDSLRFLGWSEGEHFQVDQFHFSDGIILSAEDISALAGIPVSGTT